MIKKILLSIISITTLYSSHSEFKKIEFKEYVFSFDKELEGKSNMFKLNRINLEVNLFNYKNDTTLYHINDYWANQEEFFYNRGGDCEDFAISKLFHLKRLHLGSDYRFIFYKNEGKNKNHLALLVVFENKFWILDNKIKDPKEINLQDLSNLTLLDINNVLKKKLVESHCISCKVFSSLD